MKESYLLAGIRMGPLIRLLRRNRIDWTNRTIRRVFFLLQSAVWSSFFACLEEWRYGKILAAVPPVRDPVFIIGHWRTGTTYLHQLLALDPIFHAPTLFQVAVPEGFMVSRQYYKPVMNNVIPKKRPMDNVKLGMDEPQEDEYALFRMTGYSPLEKLIFPYRPGFFLSGDLDFLPPQQCQEHWESKLQLFYRKLFFKTGRIIVSKNPFNSLRIMVLHRLFPEARFIHVVRHPEEVIPSTIHMFDIVQRQNILNNNHYRPGIPDITALLDQTWTRIRKDLSLLPANLVTEIRYEKLVSSPVETMLDIYEGFGFPFTQETRDRIRSFSAYLSGYTPNKFTLDSNEREMIKESLSHHYRMLDYK